MSRRLGSTRFSRCPPRCGASTLEAVVAFTLLAAVLAVATPLLVRHDRLLAAHRDYQLALEELSNQLDRLTALPPEELSKALAQLAPSTLAAAKLPEAKLQAELTPADMGQRLTLRLSWGPREPRASTVGMAAWVFPQPKPPAGETEQEGRP